MSRATVGALNVKLGLDSAQFTQGLQRSQTQMEAFSNRLKGMMGALAAIGITASLAGIGRAAVTAANEMAESMARIDTVLRNTGNEVGFTSDQLRDMADELMRTSSFSQRDILDGVTKSLLRFESVQGDVFRRAQQAVVNYAAYSGQSLESVSQVVGRALSNPAQALSRLQRAGIDLGEEQTRLVQKFIDAGDAAGAQNAILAGLEERYADVAQAQRDAAPGSALANEWETLLVTIGEVIRKVLDPITEAMAKGLEVINKAREPIQSTATAIITAVSRVFTIINQTVGAFLRAVLQGVGGKIMPLLRALGEAIMLVVKVFEDLLGPGSSGQNAWADFGDFVGKVLGIVVDVVTVAITTITDILSALRALLKGDFSSMWGYLARAVAGVINLVLRIFRTLPSGVRDYVRATFNAIKAWLTDRFPGIVRVVRWAVNAIIDLFRRLLRSVGDDVRETAETLENAGEDIEEGLGRPFERGAARAREAVNSLREDLERVLDALRTPEEQALRRLEEQRDVLRRALASGDISQSDFEQAMARAENASGLIVANADKAKENLVEALRAAEELAQTSLRKIKEESEALAEALREQAEAFQEQAERFGDQFANALERAVRGDWRGLLADFLNGIFRNAASQLGQMLFRANAGGGGNLFSSVFSALSGLPKFANGGAFTVGGTGAIDSQLVQFWATPGERVEVSRPGSQTSGERTLIVQVDKGQYFDVAVREVAAPIAAEAGAAAYERAVSDIPGQMAARHRYSTRG